MHNSANRIPLLLIVLVMAACTPSLTSSVNPIAASTSEPDPLPDLIIKFMYIEMEGRQGNCVEAYTPYGMRVLVENIGPTNAGPFAVDLNAGREMVEAGLAAGQSIELHFTGTTPGGRYEAYADATHQVAESQEDNNSYSFLAPTPTPPPLCTATPSPTP